MVSSNAAESQQKRQQQQGTRIIIDTDVGFDDLVAIKGILAHQKNGAEVALVTTVAGVNTAQGGAELIQNVLRAFQSSNSKAPIPSVAIGLEQKEEKNRWSWLEEERKNLNVMNKKMTTQYGIDNTSTKVTSLGKATDEALNILEESPDKSVDLICLGPLSNIYDWIRKGESSNDDDANNERTNLLEKKIKSVWIMGGNLPQEQEPGDEEPSPEFNFARDPQAAANVLSFFSEKKKPVHLLTTNDSDHRILPSQYVDSIISKIENLQHDETADKKLTSHLITTHKKLCLFWDVICAFAYTTQDTNTDQSKYDMKPTSIQVDEKSGLVRDGSNGNTTNVTRICNISLPDYADWIQSLVLDTDTKEK